jgi:micrococcal nuclease
VRFPLGCALLFLLAVTSGLCAERAAPPKIVLSGMATRVIDGDTIDVLLSSGRIRVRLHGIDAPERDQSGGAAATVWLTRQLQDRQVLLEPVSQDQYDRMIAVVHLGDRNINRDLVQAGHAWAYRQYMRRGDAGLCALEEEARRKARGLWATTAHAPWEHRATQGRGPFRDYTRSTVADCRAAIGNR